MLATCVDVKSSIVSCTLHSISPDIIIPSVYHVLNDVLQLKADDITKSYKKQLSRISQEWDGMPDRKRTVITASMVEEDVCSFAAHKLRISDYLQAGTWHQVTDDGNWVFYDSEDDSQPDSIKPMHLR